MTVFADSSALVKIYIPEAGHQAISENREPVVISQLARVEVPAAFWRKHRTGELAASDAAILAEDFEHDYQGDPAGPPRFSVLPISEERLRVAALAVARHGLRAYDAVQLASALAVRDGANQADLRFATFDQIGRASCRERV